MGALRNVSLIVTWCFSKAYEVFVAMVMNAKAFGETPEHKVISELAQFCPRRREMKGTEILFTAP